MDLNKKADAYRISSDGGEVYTMSCKETFQKTYFEDTASVGRSSGSHARPDMALWLASGRYNKHLDAGSRCMCTRTGSQCICETRVLTCCLKWVGYYSCMKMEIKAMPKSGSP